MTEEPPKEPSPPVPPPDIPAGEAEEMAVDDGEAVSPDPDDQPSQDELREKLEEEIKQVRVDDLILQSTVSILNLAARRIAKEDERDLAQGKAGIDATRSMLEHLPEDARERVQEAVSELQMLYAKEASEAAAGEKPEDGETT